MPLRSGAAAFRDVLGSTAPDRRLVKGLQALVFAGLNTALVVVYGYAMEGKLEPLKHEPERWVIQPLALLTAVVSLGLYPVLRRVDSRVIRALTLYAGFMLVASLYGAFLWSAFPDGGLLAIPLAWLGAHLYGWPVFLAVLLVDLLLGRWLFGVSAAART